MSGNLAEKLSLPPAESLPPLVVDLDGTLIQSDLLVESFFALVSTSPWHALKTLRYLCNGRAALKEEIAHHATIDSGSLPFNIKVLEWLKIEKENGRNIYLASASHEKYVREIADHLGFFTDVFASTAKINLKGKAKADVLCQTFGQGGFDYAGNDAADMAVWQQADNVIAVNPTPHVQREVRKRFPGAKILISDSLRWKDYVQVFRLHQWLKNLLIFVPAFMAHDFNLATAGLCILAFISFSLCASSAYILNDLLDLRHDREHHSKRHRPFASGKVSPHYGLFFLVLTLGLSLGIATLLPWKFILALSTYYALTIGYSAYLKRKIAVDVVALALLYNMRLAAGAAAIAIPLSPWLLSFSAFLFLCLALIKRCAEIIARQGKGNGDPSGRGYRLTDLPILESMASASGYVAALTSGLYISSPTVTQLYGYYERLWAIPVILLFWISRMLILTHRGEMNDDPVLFAARDRTSVVCGGLLVLIVLASI